MIRLLRAAMVGIFSMVLAARAYAAPFYTVTDLGTLGGSNNSNPQGINIHGEVTGGSANQAFLYNGSTMVNIGTLGGAAIGRGVNARGEVTGTASIQNR